MTTLKARPQRRGTAKDTLATPVGWADIDFGNAGHKRPEGQLPNPPNAESAKALVAEAGLPEPTVWVFSGGGWYPLWKWSRTLSFEQAKELVERIQNLLLLASKKHDWHYGTGVKDMARVLRLVGGSNMKTGAPRPCRITGGSGKLIDPDSIPPAPTQEVVRKADPTAAPPPKKTTAPYVETGERGPWDVFDEMVEWVPFLSAHGLEYVGSDDYGDRYVRDGASSKHSVKVMHNTGCLVAFSTSVDLPILTGLTKAAVLAYWTGYAGDRGDCLRDLLAGINPSGVPQHVIDAMAATGTHTMGDRLFKGITIVRPPASAAAPEPITDQDLDDYVRTFTRWTRPRALTAREQWARTDGPARLGYHLRHLVRESMLGYYPSEHAVRALVAACSPHGVDPKTALKTALAAILNAKVPV
jgi:hypothetical protein